MIERDLAFHFSLKNAKERTITKKKKNLENFSNEMKL